MFEEITELRFDIFVAQSLQTKIVVQECIDVSSDNFHVVPKRATPATRLSINGSLSICVSSS